MQGQLRHHLVGDGERLVEAVDAAELAEAGQAPHRARAEARVEAGDDEVAFAGLHARREREQQGRLAGPCRSGDDGQASCRDVEVDAAVHPARARAQAEAAALDRHALWGHVPS